VHEAFFHYFCDFSLLFVTLAVHVKQKLFDF
jgi:hypothetical protein